MWVDFTPFGRFLPWQESPRCYLEVAREPESDPLVNIQVGPTRYPSCPMWVPATLATLFPKLWRRLMTRDDGSDPHGPAPFFKTSRR